MGAAFHGLILLGYGFAAKSVDTVCKGFAYLHHSYMQLISNDQSFQIRKGDTVMIDVLQSLSQDEELKVFLKSLLPPTKFGHGFSEHTDALLERKGDKLLNYLKKMKIPAFDANAFSMADIKGWDPGPGYWTV